jgi:hypothetical protein
MEKEHLGYVTAEKKNIDQMDHKINRIGRYGLDTYGSESKPVVRNLTH